MSHFQANHYVTSSQNKTNWSRMSVVITTKHYYKGTGPSPSFQDIRLIKSVSEPGSWLMSRVVEWCSSQLKCGYTSCCQLSSQTHYQEIKAQQGRLCAWLIVTSRTLKHQEWRSIHFQTLAWVWGLGNSNINSWRQWKHHLEWHSVGHRNLEGR